MGLGAIAKSVGSKVGDVAGKISGKLGALGVNYRTNVLYDFSLVSKAVFHIFIDGGSDKSVDPFNPLDTRLAFRLPRKINYLKTLPVQINPNNIRFRYGNMIAQEKDNITQTSKSLGNYEVVRKSCERSQDQLSIDLEYDVYDEYMMRTAEGVVFESSMSLLSSNDTSLKELCEFSCMPNIYVLFEWGDIEYFGIFESMDATFNTFSQWGIPLKASASIDITKQILATSKGNKEVPPKSSTVISEVDKAVMKAYRTPENLMLRAQLIATQALR